VYSAPAQRRVRRGVLAAIGLLVASAAVLAAGGPGTDHAIALSVQRFMLFYSGVFALIALTASVGAGLIAADQLTSAVRDRRPTFMTDARRS
jgi:hypothetical protein